MVSLYRYSSDNDPNKDRFRQTALYGCRTVTSRTDEQAILDKFSFSKTCHPRLPIKDPREGKLDGRTI